MRFKPVILGLLAISLPAPVVAQSAPKPPPIRVIVDQPAGLTERQLEIIRIVRNAEGYITKELHKEFWDSLPADAKTPEAQRILRPTFEAIIGPAQRLGRETWESARLSLRAGRPMRTKGLGAAIEATLSASDEPGFRSGATKSTDSVDRILAAAAYRTPLQTPAGPVFINEDMIETTLAGIEAGTRRMEILVNPVWDVPLKQYRYPKAHVSVLAPWPFAIEQGDLTAPNGVQGTMYTLTTILSDKRMQFISFGDFSAGHKGQQLSWPDPQGTAIRNVKATLDAIGAAGRPPYGTSWREHIAATGSGMIEDADGKMYVTVRNVFLPEKKGFLSFMAISQISLFDSQTLLDQLEAQTQVLG